MVHFMSALYQNGALFVPRQYCLRHLFRLG